MRPEYSRFHVHDFLLFLSFLFTGLMLINLAVSNTSSLSQNNQKLNDRKNTMNEFLLIIL